MKIIEEDSLLNKITLIVFQDLLESKSISWKLLRSTEKYSSHLRNYLLWDFLGDSLVKNKETIYLNKYYWLLLFYENYKKAEGEDVGIEQLISDLIQSIFDTFPDFDHTTLEVVRKQVEDSTLET